MSKVIRLAKALKYESIKRLPYIAFILVIIILVQVVATGAKVADNVRISKENSESNQVLLEKISTLSEDNKQLSEDNKSLSEQNNRLADQSNRYLDCIAKLFAKYTRDYMPVVIQDLNTCSAENIFFGQGGTVTGNPTSQTPAQPTSPDSTLPPKANPKADQNSLDRFFRIPHSLLRFVQQLIG